MIKPKPSHLVFAAGPRAGRPLGPGTPMGIPVAVGGVRVDRPEDRVRSEAQRD